MTDDRTSSKGRRATVIVGVDGSEDGLRAARYAAGSAIRRDADLVVLHAVDDAAVAGTWGIAYDPTALQDAGQVVVDDAIDVAKDRGMDPDRISGEVVLGNPAAILADRSADAQLVVVGRRASSGLERMFVGSTSVAVAGMSVAPVVVISRASNPNPTGGKKCVAVAVGPQNTGPAAIEFGFAEADRRGCKLLAVTVVGQDSQTIHEEALQRLDKAIAPVADKYPGVEVETRLLSGEPVDALVDLSGDVDLLVIDMKKHPILGWIAGGVSRGIMAHARSPLAICH
ncbi:universal stress protein [Cutibacterium equinum]|uniref:Universal stress protein n=1 Tax=Cutibacterium equinum TaxID=3016342 RepID=A0ABY7R0J2_9ACTN|nr:universal stress protein [Cutibacterium equinum]WCC80761.1 universal stress protein [Cutibacterium equinum]